MIRGQVATQDQNYAKLKITQLQNVILPVCIAGFEDEAILLKIESVCWKILNGYNRLGMSLCFTLNSFSFIGTVVCWFPRLPS